MDESDDSFWELLDSSRQQFDILCSGDKDGNINFNIFGIFPIGKVVSPLLIFGFLFNSLSMHALHIIMLFSMWLSNAIMYQNIRDIVFRSPLVGNHASFQLMDASICKVNALLFSVVLVINICLLH